MNLGEDFEERFIDDFHRRLAAEEASTRTDSFGEDFEKRFIDDFHRRIAAEETPTRTDSSANRGRGRSRGIVDTLNSSQNRNRRANPETTSTNAPNDRRRRSNLSSALERASEGGATPHLTRGQRNGNMNQSVRGARLVRMIRRFLGRR